MKLLIMCEGPNELAVVNLLLDHDRFTFTRDDLVGLVAYHARQLATSTAVKNALSIYQGDFAILRVGDKLSDALKIPAEYKHRVTRIEKYCTKPEIEMLFIIAEDKTDEFEKDKSKTKPKDFAKANIVCGRKKYNNSTQFYKDYFENDIDLLVNCFREYKRIKKHAKDEHYVADLLK